MFVELYSSNGTVFAPSDVQNNTMTFTNFTGMTDETGERGGEWHFKTLVRTTGSHHLKFELGDGVAHASNSATATRVTTSNANGTYTTGDSILMAIELSEPVNLERSAPILQDGTYKHDSIITATLDENTYMLVADSGANSIRIINMTHPFSPSQMFYMKARDQGR